MKWGEGGVVMIRSEGVRKGGGCRYNAEIVLIKSFTKT